MAESSTHLFPSHSGGQCHWVKAKVSAKPVPGGSSREESTCWPFPASGSHLLSWPPDPFLELLQYLTSVITSLTTSPGSDLPLISTLGITFETHPEKTGSSLHLKSLHVFTCQVPFQVAGMRRWLSLGANIQPTTGSPSLLFFLSSSPAFLPNIEHNAHLTSVPGVFKEARGRVCRARHVLGDLSNQLAVVIATGTKNIRGEKHWGKGILPQRWPSDLTWGLVCDGEA